jgi:hypothetical protein
MRGVMILIQDVSGQVRAQEALEANRLELQHVNDELNTPVTIKYGHSRNMA